MKEEKKQQSSIRAIVDLAIVGCSKCMYGHRHKFPMSSHDPNTIDCIHSQLQSIEA
jgi:hypothetical protein